MNIENNYINNNNDTDYSKTEKEKLNNSEYNYNINENDPTIEKISSISINIKLNANEKEYSKLKIKTVNNNEKNEQFLIKEKHQYSSNEDLENSNLVDNTVDVLEDKSYKENLDSLSGKDFNLKIAKEIIDKTILAISNSANRLISRNPQLKELKKGDDIKKEIEKLKKEIEKFVETEYGVKNNDNIFSEKLNQAAKKAEETKSDIKNNEEEIQEETFDQILDKTLKETGQMRDEMREQFEKLPLSQQTFFNRFKIKSKIAQEYSLGNCEEMSSVALFKLLDKGFYNTQLDIVRIKNGGHNFLVIGRARNSNPEDYKTWGDEAVICDPWKNDFFLLSELESKLCDASLEDFEQKGEASLIPFDPNKQSLEVKISGLLSPKELQLDMPKNLNNKELVTYHSIIQELEKFDQAASLFDKIDLANNIIDIIQTHDEEFKYQPTIQTLYQQLCYFKHAHALKSNFKIAKDIMERTEKSVPANIPNLKETKNNDSIFKKFSQIITKSQKDDKVDLKKSVDSEFNHLRKEERTQFNYNKLLAKYGEKYSTKNDSEIVAIQFFNLLDQGFYNAQLDIVRIENGNRTFFVIGRDVNSDPTDYKTWGEGAIICDPLTKKIFPLEQVEPELFDAKDDSFMEKEQNLDMPSNPRSQKLRLVTSNFLSPNELRHLNFKKESQEYKSVAHIEKQLEHFHEVVSLSKKIDLAKQIIKFIQDNPKLKIFEPIQTLYQQLIYFNSKQGTQTKQASSEPSLLGKIGGLWTHS